MVFPGMRTQFPSLRTIFWKSSVEHAAAVYADAPEGAPKYAHVLFEALPALERVVLLKWPHAQTRRVRTGDLRDFVVDLDVYALLARTAAGEGGIAVDKCTYDVRAWRDA